MGTSTWMNSSRPDGTWPDSAPRLMRTLMEMGLVLVAGLLFGCLANALSPVGLRWTRNYFPLAAVEGVPAGATAVSESPAASEEAEAVARITARGYTAWTFERAAEAFAEPSRLTGRMVWVDARAEIPYRRGHIPGARQLDPYRPEQNLLEVVAACLRAERVIVYCSGGRCEDAELAASLLEQAGVPRERLVIYVGGFSEWSARGQPVESAQAGGSGGKESDP
ncbi:MAG: hypothetical protein KatS3mg132_658 [Limisphaera sp.]|nr:MAG: hypothetical protein KatS3mg132_658 [Limisphaera sp.]